MVSQRLYETMASESTAIVVLLVTMGLTDLLTRLTVGGIIATGFVTMIGWIVVWGRLSSWKAAS